MQTDNPNNTPDVRPHHAAVAALKAMIGRPWLEIQAALLVQALELDAMIAKRVVAP